jgi:hypothetical protein
MKVDGVIAQLPRMSADQRKLVRTRALAMRDGGRPDEKVAAGRVLDAFDALAQTEDEALAARPLAQRVIEAFHAKPMKDGERTAITALLRHPGSTSAELSAAAGWRGNTWHLRFGTMCRDRAAALWPAPGSEVRDAEFFTGILADFDKVDSRFTMKPEVAEAFAQLGL